MNKIYAVGECIVTEGGVIPTHLKKEDEFSTEFNRLTSGYIKYNHMLPVGTKVRVTIEILEDQK